MKNSVLALCVCLAMCAAAASDDQLLTARLKRQLKDEMTEEIRRELGQEIKREVREEIEKQNLIQQNIFEQKHTELRSHFQEQLDAVMTELARVQGTTDPDLELRVKELEDDMAILEQQIIVISGQMTATLNQVAAVINSLAVMQEEVAETRLEIVEDRVTGLDTEISDLSHDVDAMQHIITDMDERLTCVEDSNFTETGERYSFLAHRTCYQASGTVVFDVARHNRGNVYDTTTGVWTAPVDGIYHFFSQLLVYDTVHETWAYFDVDGTEAARSQIYYHGDSEDVTVTLVADLELKAGQEVTVRTFCASHVDGFGDEYLNTWFGGFLIQQ